MQIRHNSAVIGSLANKVQSAVGDTEAQTAESEATSDLSVEASFRSMTSKASTLNGNMRGVMFNTVNLLRSADRIFTDLDNDLSNNLLK